jgi:YVTN family beta-propeller protein
MPASRGLLVIGIVALTVTAGYVMLVEDHLDLPLSQRSSPTSSPITRESVPVRETARAGLPVVSPQSVSSTLPTALPDVQARADPPRLNCQSPHDPLYDSGANEVIVNCQDSNNVTVISPTNNTVIASIPVGDTASVSILEMAYDPGRGEVFVANKNNTNGNTVSVISDKTNTVVATVTVGHNPSGLAYDSGKGEVFVLNVNSNSLSVISDSTNAVVATIPVGSGPNDVTYDSGKGEVFVPDWNTGTVSVVSDATNSVVASIPVGAEPDQAIYDPGTNEVFVLDNYSTSVSVISDATNTVVATVPVGTPGFFEDGMAYDSGRGEVFVSNFGSADVSVISDRTNSVVATVPTGPDPQRMTYVPAQGEIFLESVVGPNASTGRNISVISDSTNRIVASIPEPDTAYGAAYDPGLNELFVPTFPDSVNVISTLNNTVLETIVVGYLPPSYNVTFVEAGLPSGAAWQAGFVLCEECGEYLWGTSTTSMEEFYDMVNGTLDYEVSTSTPGFSPTGPFGSFDIRGANVTIGITFVPAYQTVFTEEGLGNTSVWSVTIQGTVTLSNGSLVHAFIETHNSSYGSPGVITFELPNGSYSYSATASGYVQVNGHVTVSGSQRAPITITFNKPAPWWAGSAPEWILVAAVAFAVAMVVGLVLVIRRRRRTG